MGTQDWESLVTRAGDLKHFLRVVIFELLKIGWDFGLEICMGFWFGSMYIVVWKYVYERGNSSLSKIMEARCGRMFLTIISVWIEIVVHLEWWMEPG